MDTKRLSLWVRPGTHREAAKGSCVRLTLLFKRLSWWAILGILPAFTTGCTLIPNKPVHQSALIERKTGTSSVPSTSGQPVARAEGLTTSAGPLGPPSVPASQAPDNQVSDSVTAPTPGLGTCLYEAEQLNRLGTPAQKNLVNVLYRNIRAAQQYEPMAGKLASGTSNTIGPLYQFAINDACNAVSQGLLSVLKKQVPVTGGSRD